MSKSIPIRNTGRNGAGSTAMPARKATRASRTVTPQNVTPVKTAARGTTKTGSKKKKVDHRRQLFNGGQSGPIEAVQLPVEMITSLLGIMLDFDPDRFREDVVSRKVRADPVKFYKRFVRKMLARHPVFSKAEVRNSGRGLHVIIRFEKPLEFATDADRQRWSAIVKVIQRLLPTDPGCPGITALTRSLGSVNSKNDGTVKLLHKGQPVPAEDVVGLFNEARSSPFRTIARLLFGDDHVMPCPVCNAPDSKLDALDFVGKCYGGCGKVRIDQLFDVLLKVRPSRKGE